MKRSIATGMSVSGKGTRSEAALVQKQKTGVSREGHAFTRAKKSAPKGATTLPKAGAKPEGRSD